LKIIIEKRNKGQSWPSKKCRNLKKGSDRILLGRIVFVVTSGSVGFPQDGAVMDLVAFLDEAFYEVDFFFFE
jgi:hypothetical protein